jgi:hypothetical protein
VPGTETRENSGPRRVREGACPGHNAIYYTRLCALVAGRVSWKEFNVQLSCGKNELEIMPGRARGSLIMQSATTRSRPKVGRRKNC